MMKFEIEIQSTDARLYDNLRNKISELVEDEITHHIPEEPTNRLINSAFNPNKKDSFSRGVILKPGDTVEVEGYPIRTIEGDIILTVWSNFEWEGKTYTVARIDHHSDTRIGVELARKFDEPLMMLIRKN